MLEIGFQYIPLLLPIALEKYLQYDIGYLFFILILIISILLILFSPMLGNTIFVKKPRFAYFKISLISPILGLIIASALDLGFYAISFFLFFWLLSFVSFLIFQTIPKQNLCAFFPAALASFFISFGIAICSFFGIFLTPSISPGAITLLISTLTITTYFNFFYKISRVRAF